MVRTTLSNQPITQQCSGFYSNLQKSPSYPMNFTKHTTLPLQLVDQNQQRSSQPTFKPIKPKPNAAHHFNPTSITPYSAQAVSIQRRNARERNRVKQVNDGFSNLRQHIPNEVIATLTADPSATHPGRGVNRKLSKVDTLKLTVEYIRRLQDTLMMADAVQDTSQPTTNHENRVSQQYFEYQPHAERPQSHSSNYPSATTSPAPSSVSSDTSTSSYGAGYYLPHHYPQDLKHENYDSSDPQDDEILDCISWWQQQ